MKLLPPKWYCIDSFQLSQALSDLFLLRNRRSLNSFYCWTHWRLKVRFIQLSFLFEFELLFNSLLFLLFFATLECSFIKRHRHFIFRPSTLPFVNQPLKEYQDLGALDGPHLLLDPLAHSMVESLVLYRFFPLCDLLAYLVFALFFNLRVVAVLLFKKRYKIFQIFGWVGLLILLLLNLLIYLFELAGISIDGIFWIWCAHSRLTGLWEWFFSLGQGRGIAEEVFFDRRF